MKILAKALLLWLFLPVAQSDAGQLALSVLGPDGAELSEERYVAVVAEGSAWSAPKVEHLVPAGASLPSLDLTPGRYRVFCSAIGYSLAYRPVVHVTGAAVEDEAGKETCRLKPLVHLAGRVVDDLGSPIEGATVGFATLSRLESPIRLSAQGDRHLRRNYQVQSQPNGTFVLPVIPGYTSSLWFEVPGFAPKLMERVRFPEVDGLLGEVVLSAGGHLSVKVDLPVNFPVENYKMALSASVPLVEASLLEQHLPMTGAVSWPGLAPGTYEVWLRGLVAAKPGQRPYRLGEVQVVRSGRAELVVSRQVLASKLLAESDGELRVLVPGSRVETEPGTTRVASWRLFRWYQGEVLSWPLSEQTTVDRAGEFVISEACRAGALYWLETVEEVSFPFRLIESCRAKVDLHPAALLTGRVVGSPGEPGPLEPRLLLTPCELKAGSLPADPYPLQLDDEGVWSRRLPRGCFDVELRTRNFAPVRWRALRLDRRHDVGEVSFHPGATLLVRVVEAETGQPLQGARVGIVHAQQVEMALARLLDAPTSEPELVRARTDAWGWASVPGLQPGVIFVEVHADGRAAELVGEFELLPGRELIVEELEVSEPASLRIEVLSEEMMPSDLRLRVEATPSVACTWFPRVQKSARRSTAGGFYLEELRAGLWRVSVSLSTQEGIGVASLTEEIDLSAGGTSDLIFDLADSLFSGVVMRESEPIVGAELSFVPEAAGSIASARTDQDGEFRVFLSEAGSYTVRVRVLEPEPFSFEVADVRFETTDRSVEIQVPQGRIGGVVLDRDGELVVGAQIAAMQESAGQPLIALAESELDGTFLLKGLAAGEWLLSASKEGSESIPQAVDLAEQQAVAGVRLEIRDSQAVQGRVVDAAGYPVPLAEALLYTLSSDAGNFPVASWVRADEQGRFEMRSALGASSVQWAVRTPGFPITGARTQLVGDQELRLVVPRESGTLTVNASSLDRPSRRFWALISDAGGVVPITVLSSSARWTQNVLVIPQIAPGNWRLVEYPSQSEFLRMLAQDLEPAALAAFEILPYRETRVDL